MGRALAGLPHEQREVVMLRLYSGMTFRQIAALQGVPANTARGRYRYGLARLRRLLGSEDRS